LVVTQPGAMNSDDNIVFVIAGPTAAGKTAIAIALAQQLHTSILSADSRQCYKEMTIGTAKPSQEELKEVLHYFIDAFSVTAHISAADFENLGLKYLDEIFKKSRYAVICGGTGLYIKALCDGLDDMPQIDKEIDSRINQQYKELGIEWLQEEVKKTDPGFYESAETGNPARLIRALVFRLSTGESILNYKTGVKKSRNFRAIKVIIDLPRTQLYQRINKRVDDMMEYGLLEEVIQLQPYRHLKNLQTVGYSELFDYLDNKYGLEEAVDKIKQHTRNYAKRQMTWFRKEANAVVMDARDKDIIQKIVQLAE
jgi:tRNA dimethylallyltransferase